MGLVKLGAQGQAPWLLGYKGSADANLNKEKSRDTMHDWKLSQKSGQGGVLRKIDSMCLLCRRESRHKVRGDYYDKKLVAL